MSSPEMNRGTQDSVRRYTPLLRTVARGILTPVMRGDTVMGVEEESGETNLQKFERLLLEGNGGLVLIRHSMLKDPPLVAYALLKSKVIKRRQILYPHAIHHLYRASIAIGRLLEFQLDPVATANTVSHYERIGKMPPKKGEGGAKFVEHAIDYWRRGQVVIVAPEGERRSNLDEMYKEKSVGMLFHAAAKAGIENIVTMYMDTRPAGRITWNNGYHLLERCDVRFGEVKTYSQIMAEAGRKFTRVDKEVVWPGMLRAAAIPRPSRD